MWIKNQGFLTAGDGMLNQHEYSIMMSSETLEKFVFKFSTLVSSKKEEKKLEKSEPA